MAAMSVQQDVGLTSALLTLCLLVTAISLIGHINPLPANNGYIPHGAYQPFAC